MRRFFLTTANIGLIPKIAVLLSTLVGIIIALLLLQYITLTNLLLLSILLAVIAAKQIDVYKNDKSYKREEIVIDKFIAICLTISIANTNPENMIIIAPLCFIFFILFDYWKPSVIGRLETKLTSSWGIVLPSLISGLAAAILTNASYTIIQRFF